MRPHRRSHRTRPLAEQHAAPPRARAPSAGPTHAPTQPEDRALELEAPGAAHRAPRARARGTKQHAADTNRTERTRPRAREPEANAPHTNPSARATRARATRARGPRRAGKHDTDAPDAPQQQRPARNGRRARRAPRAPRATARAGSSARARGDRRRRSPPVAERIAPGQPHAAPRARPAGSTAERTRRRAADARAAARPREAPAPPARRPPLSIRRDLCVCWFRRVRAWRGVAVRGAGVRAGGAAVWLCTGVHIFLSGRVRCPGGADVRERSVDEALGAPHPSRGAARWLVRRAPGCARRGARPHPHPQGAGVGCAGASTPPYWWARGMGVPGSPRPCAVVAFLV